MKVYYLQSTKNDRAEKENYDVFLPEIFTLIGTSITTISESEISTLSSSDALFIGEGDYIVLQADGTKHVCGADKVWKRFEKID